MLNRADGSLTNKILIPADIWHGCQHLGQATATRATEGSLQYLAMLLLSAPIVFRGTLLQSPDQIIIQSIRGASPWLLRPIPVRHGR